MALDESPSAPVGDTRAAQGAPDLPTQVSQPTQSSIPSLPSSAAVQTGEDEASSTANPPTKSLFGPFPPSVEADPQPNATSEPSQLPMSSPSDQIQPTSENQPLASQSMLNFNAQNHEPVSAAQINMPGSPNRTTLPPLSREKTTPAIGPATDKPTPIPKESEIEGPVLFITLLLSSNGARHPYKLDEKYLRKRNVTVEGNNPINISLYKLKELILRDWRDGESILSQCHGALQRTWELAC